jgi:uncharacterized membrane protein YwzB
VFVLWRFVRGKDLMFAPNTSEMRNIRAIPKLSDNICDIMAHHWSSSNSVNNNNNVKAGKVNNAAVGHFLPTRVRVVPHKVSRFILNIVEVSESMHFIHTFVIE